MISYIFKSKTKNILLAISSILLMFATLEELHAYFLMGAWEHIILKIIAAIPYLLIFLYMVMLKKEYKIKQLLFPIAFGLLILLSVYSITECFDSYTFASINGLSRFFVNFNIRIVMILGYVFCFIGTLSNFKRVGFLRVGVPICTIAILILSAFNYSIPAWVDYSFYSYLHILAIDYLNNIYLGTITILFYTSIFVLTLTRKSQYIDITPFVEERKRKKQIKKAKKLEKENQDFSSSLVPDGFWRCMGCGEILPNSINECECGYKR